MIRLDTDKRYLKHKETEIGKEKLDPTNPNQKKN